MDSTFERVGTRGWMAPWAQNDLRLLAEDINPRLDIYPLAKVLWSMIAARRRFSVLGS